jgi:hypothetical protein
LHAKKGKSRCVPWLELYEHIDVAVRPNVAAQNRAKERELADVIALAKAG